MNYSSNSILQKRYEGFLATPTLWLNKNICNLEQFTAPTAYHTVPNAVDSTLRLGKYVERLVAFQLSRIQNITILAENIQIQHEKHTVGELDCLLMRNAIPIHLEVIYKFYIYDPSVGNTEVEHCIGPNRKDALLEKLKKLKNKQLPLLHTNYCKPYLQALNLNPEHILQQVYFKAQLFLPLNMPRIKLKTLNHACIVGFYISVKELKEFTACKFYKPIKKDWLISPHTHVDWVNLNTIITITATDIQQHYAVLLWVKFKNGSIKKVFLIWW